MAKFQVYNTYTKEVTVTVTKDGETKEVVKNQKYLRGLSKEEYYALRDTPQQREYSAKAKAGNDWAKSQLVEMY